jgi:hypothetical protein
MKKDTPIRRESSCANLTAGHPASEMTRKLREMPDQVIAWSGALKDLRTPKF